MGQLWAGRGGQVSAGDVLNDASFIQQNIAALLVYPRLPTRTHTRTHSHTHTPTRPHAHTHIAYCISCVFLFVFCVVLGCARTRKTETERGREGEREREREREGERERERETARQRERQRPPTKCHTNCHNLTLVRDTAAECHASTKRWLRPAARRCCPICRGPGRHHCRPAAAAAAGPFGGWQRALGA